MQSREWELELFVPGRICLFGEHSDWAAAYRRLNSEIEKGYTIICGTNQGLYSRVRKQANEIIFREDAKPGGPGELRMTAEPQALLKTAEEGGYWSYVAGVAYQIITHYRVGGLEILNYRTDLPAKKGLSSSAAVCVTVARAFNRLYDLKMTTRGEMDMAYRGEITTPSRCGRMDQGCAYGSHPILMTFDGDSLDVQELRVGLDLHYVIVDLISHKNTIKILSDLNKAYPFADTDVSKRVQRYLGKENRKIVERAIFALERGDPAEVGRMMKEAQEQFDSAMTDACPEQLRAPVLHSLLSDPRIVERTHGGKGVGSQGDGAAQLLARDAHAQQELLTIVERELGMRGYPLTLRKTRAVKKALITAAGFGTRLFPYTKVARKELMPIEDSDGLVKPLILKHVEDLADAGIGSIAVIIRESEKDLFDRLFRRPVDAQVYERLAREGRQYADKIDSMGRNVEYIFQERPGGLGDAVLSGSEWVKGGAFLLVLGDHVFQPAERSVSCIAQVLQEYETLDRPVIGLARTRLRDVSKFGCVAGSWEVEGSLLNIAEFKEKPSEEYAQEYLKVPGLGEDEFLSVFGLYVIDEKVLEILRVQKASAQSGSEELQLTGALEEYRRRNGCLGLVISGRKDDIGTPQGWTGSWNPEGSR